MIPLLPCPFCGGQARYRKNEYGFDRVGCYSEFCETTPESCGNTPEECAANWNDRPKPNTPGLRLVFFNGRLLRENEDYHWENGTLIYPGISAHLGQRDIRVLELQGVEWPTRALEDPKRCTHPTPMVATHSNLSICRACDTVLG